MPTKFLKPKNMRRGLLALLLAAPLVYMFGSLFTALNGAHGAFPFAQDSLVKELNLTSSDFNQGTIGFENGVINSNNNTQVYSNKITIYGSLVSIDIPDIVDSYAIYYYASNDNFISAVAESWLTDNIYEIPGNTSYLRIRCHSSPTFSPSSLSYCDVSFYDESLDSHSDYLFGQFFAKDNWVASLGEKAVNNDTGIGLPFVGDLISYIDENAIPLSNSAYGYFIWGYSSYILNVLAVYMVVSIAASLVLIPMKVVDSLEERING